jgi:hypothetical protein
MYFPRSNDLSKVLPRFSFYSLFVLLSSKRNETKRNERAIKKCHRYPPFQDCSTIFFAFLHFAWFFVCLKHSQLVTKLPFRQETLFLSVSCGFIAQIVKLIFL